MRPDTLRKVTPPAGAAFDLGAYEFATGTGTGTGLAAIYWNNQDFTVNTVTLTDKKIK